MIFDFERGGLSCASGVTWTGTLFRTPGCACYGVPWVCCFARPILAA